MPSGISNSLLLPIIVIQALMQFTTNRIFVVVYTYHCKNRLTAEWTEWLPWLPTLVLDFLVASSSFLILEQGKEEEMHK